VPQKPDPRAFMDLIAAAVIRTMVYEAPKDFVREP
jgi:hypothetical protein